MARDFREQSRAKESVKSTKKIEDNWSKIKGFGSIKKLCICGKEIPRTINKCDPECKGEEKDDESK